MSCSAFWNHGWPSLPRSRWGNGHPNEHSILTEAGTTRSANIFRSTRTNYTKPLRNPIGTLIIYGYLWQFISSAAQPSTCLRSFQPSGTSNRSVALEPSEPQHPPAPGRSLSKKMINFHQFPPSSASFI